MELVKNKWDESPNPGKNHALVWFMIAVKTSKFSPWRVNKHHSAVSAMCVLMCKDPMVLFDTLLRFSAPSTCPLYPCTCMPFWPFGLWALTPKPSRLHKGASMAIMTIWQHLATRFVPSGVPTNLHLKLVLQIVFTCILMKYSKHT